MYYRPDKVAVCADVIPYYENGTFYLFYLRDYRDPQHHGEGCPWCLLTSKDLVHFEDHGEVIPRGEIQEQDLYVFTGSCIKYEQMYYIFYTGHNPHLRAMGLPEQKILLAKSKDLFHWEKVKDFSFAAPAYLEKHDFRDPFVFYDEETESYGMLLAGRLKKDGPRNSKGVTLIAHSRDLRNWELQRKPLYAPNAFFTHECPDLFKMGQWWYLIFSDMSERVVTTYRMAKSAYGPWITPKVNCFDGHAFYAAKTVSDGKHRYLIGWNPIKNKERDFEPWQWGGNIVVHEIVQADDGTLYVKCPKNVRDSYVCSADLQMQYVVGSASFTADRKIRLGDNEGRSSCLLADMPRKCKIELDFTATDDIGDFGVLLRSDDSIDCYYSVKVELKHQRIAIDQFPRKDANVPIQAELERYCSMNVGERNHMLIIVEDSVAEIYVNDRVALSMRMFDRTGGKFGLYSLDTLCCFENVRLYV